LLCERFGLAVPKEYATWVGAERSG